MAIPLETGREDRERPGAGWRAWPLDGLLFGLGICSVPMSIAVAETFLAASLAVRAWALVRGRARFVLPRVFWYWLVWAALEVLVSALSPRFGAAWGELRHLLLIAAIFVLAPTLRRAADCVSLWTGIAAAASASCTFLVARFLWQLLFYRGPLDPVVYLRSGGLLHNWMVFGTVEIVVLAGLLELWHFFPQKRRWLIPVLAINAAAIVLSLTRMLWVSSLVVLALHLAWRRSRWLWAVPLLAGLFFLLIPGPIRARMTDSEYYSNAERIQMLRVGWRMIREHPLAGVGPGRVEEEYVKYLTPSDPVPAYHGHLHNNLVQLAAEAGLPVAAAALLFLAVLVRDLVGRVRFAQDPCRQFLGRTGLAALIGFLVAGLFDYTYGHALGLILLSFAVLTPLSVEASGQRENKVTPAAP